MIYSQVLSLLAIGRFDAVGQLKFRLEYKIIYYTNCD
jgi:hypothetical protein